jgi:hypothetical protein
MADENQTQAGKREAEGTPLFFIGNPPFLVAHVEVRNRSGERMKLKQARLSGLNLQTPRGSRLETASLFASLAPNEQTKVPFRLEINPHTPPGTYEGQIDCAGQRRPVTIKVLENWKLQVSPGRVSFKISPDQPASCTVQLVNLGNMPYALPRAAFAPLQERDGVHSALFAALKNSGGDGHQRVLDELARQLGNREVEPVTVEIKASHHDLAPGESREVELQLRKLDGLKKHRLYTGFVRFENAKLRIEIELLNQAATAERKS